jgi:hypothetical protein
MGTPDLQPTEQRRVAGRALRQRVPRSAHAAFEPAPDRPDPIATLDASNRGRIPSLIPVRFGRMLPSPFAFLRGAAPIMANDLAASPAAGVRVQACGEPTSPTSGCSPRRNATCGST